MDARKLEIVALFEAHGSLIDPQLADELAASGDGPVRVQEVLSGLQEVPFHFDVALWRRLEEKSRERAETPPPAPAAAADPEAARARKEAMRKAAAAVWDHDMQRTSREGQSDEDGHDDDPDSIDEAPHDGEERIVIEDEQGRAIEKARQEASAFRVNPRGEWRPLAASHEARLDVHADMTGNSTCEGTTGDFVTYFQDRYRQIAKMLRARRELRAAGPVERVKPGQQEVQLICMVVSTGTTKNGHRMLEVEDESGAIRCLINKNESQLTVMGDSIVQDEVIGIVGQASPKGDLIFAESLIRPDVPRPDPERQVGADVPLMAAFLSDIHVGSNTFLTENWKHMLRWLNGDCPTKREREFAGRTKYVVIPGDLVDGVGIYPGQQDELTIMDIYDQYAAFGDWMKAIPDHLEIIVQPGNHDASRPAEPQPAFTQEVKGHFDHHAARFVANPATFSMHGVKTLGYHGSSLIDFATSVTNLEYEKPLETMEQMLQCRHLAPLYGERTPVAPEHHDYLVIDDVPDLFVTGHVHVPGIRSYRGVQMINCGTWQSQTLYQKMLNFTPEPAKMPLVDLQTLRGTFVDFQRPEDAGIAA